MSVITRLYNWVAGQPARAKEVNEEFENLIKAVESYAGAVSAADVYQAGMLGAGDWTITPTINAATGSLQLVTPGGPAWLSAAGALQRTFRGPSVVGIAPPSLPLPGGYMNMGVELTAGGSEGITISVVAGFENGTEANAITNGPAVSAGKTRICNIIVKNTGGVYSITSQRDRRPWARGAYSAKSGASLNQRFEFTGVPVEVMVVGPTLSATLKVIVKLDGATVYEVGEAYAAVVYSFTPAAGSHFIETVAKHAAEAATSVLVIVREVISQNANNGTV